MERSVVEVRDIYAEDLFQWFYVHVMSSSGDGAGAIVCSNYKEVADWFIKWWEENEWPELEQRGCKVCELHPKQELENQIMYSDGNENFIFTNDPDIKLFWHDYIFIVREDCVFWSKKKATFIKAV